MTLPWSKLLYWDACTHSPRTLVNKDGALMACLRWRGPDLHSAMDSALIVQADHLNHLLMRLGAGWGLLSEERRHEVRTYLAPLTTNPAARLIDAERAAAFRQPQTYFRTETTLTLTYKASGAQTLVPRYKHWLYTNLPPTRETDSVTQFEEEIRRVVGLLGEVSEEVAWLEDEALLTYLHQTISWKPHVVAVPDPACYLDSYLPDTDLDRVWVLPHLGRWPRLGTQYLRCVSVKAYPKATHPGMLAVLATLPMEFRACVRYLPVARATAVSAAQKYGESHYGKRQRSGGSTGRVEQIALDYSDEATAYQAGIEHSRWSSGGMTQTVVVWDEDFERATAKAEKIEQVLNAAKYLAKVEGANTLAAWDGTLPGNLVRNKRQVPMTSVNLAHILPATAQTQGPVWNTHLNGPPLLRTVGRGQTPFNLDLHDDDVGHTFIVGPTGTGKSYLLATLCAAWLQYAGAQVYAWDKDQSLRCLTYAVGGAWFDISAELERQQGEGIRLDDAATKPWGEIWSPPPGWWQCYEMAGLLQTPDILPRIMGPLLRQVQTRLTGVPTLMSIDEGWVFLQQGFLENKIQDYLLTLRKANGAVVLSTPNPAHILKSRIGSDIYQSCPTKIFLANAEALTPEVREYYEALGLNGRECQIVASLVRKRQYYLKGPHGECVFELATGPVGLAFCGSSRKADLAAMGPLYATHGPLFGPAWLRYKHLEHAAEAWGNEAI